MPKHGSKQVRTKVRSPRQAPAVAKPSPSSQLKPPDIGPPGDLNTLKENLKRANKGHLLNMLKEVQNASSDEWGNPQAVKEMAKRFTEQLRLPISEQRMNAFMNAYSEASKAEQGLTVDDMIRRYGSNRVSEETIREMKKFIKPKKNA